MAVSNEELARLIVSLEVTTTRYYNGLKQAQQQTNNTANGIERRMRNMSQNIDRTFANLGQRIRSNLTAPLATVGAALSTREILRYADTWTEAGNRVRAAGEIIGLQGRSLEGIREIADDSRAGFDQTVNLYSRLLRSAGSVAESELQVAKATELVTKAFKAGGAATSEMNAGILQLGQGLSSGFLQGDELRSVRENAPVLVNIMARYFNTTIGGLKELGAQGKLTSDQVFKAILSGEKEIRAAFATTQRTIGDGFRLVENAFIQYIGLSDQTAGATGMITQALGALADNFNNIADGVLKFAAVIAGALLGRSILGLVAGVAQAITVIRTLGAVLVGIRTASVGIGAAITGAFGPLVTIVGGAAALAFQHFAAAQIESRQRIDATINRMADLGSSVKATTREIREQALATEELNEQQRKLIEAERRRQIVGDVQNLTDLRRGTQFDNAFQAFVPVEELKSAAAIVYRAWRSTFQDISTTLDLEVRTAIHSLAQELENASRPAKEIREDLFNLQLRGNIDGQTQALLDALDSVAREIQIVEGSLNLEGTSQELENLTRELQNFLLLRASLYQGQGANQAEKELKDFVDEIKSGSLSVEEMTQRLAQMAQTNPALRSVGETIINFSSDIKNAANNVSDLAVQIDHLRQVADSYVAFQTGRGRGAIETIDYLAEQNRLLGLTEEQLNLEKELAKVRTEFTEAGGRIGDGYATEEQLLELAQRRLDLQKQYSDARKKDTSGDDAKKFFEMLAAQEQGLKNLEEELTFRQQLNPFLDDHGKALIKFQKSQELLNEAKKAGVEIDRELIEIIELLSEGYAEGEVGIKKLTKSQDELRDSTQEWADFAKSSIRSFIDDLIEGKSATEALANAISNLGSRLIDLGLDTIFNSFGSLGSSNPFLNLLGLGGIPGRASGGPVRAGQPYVVGEKRPELFVPSQNGVIIPKVPENFNSQSASSVTFAPVIDARGADSAAVVRLERTLESLAQNLVPTIRREMTKAPKKGR